MSEEVSSGPETLAHLLAVTGKHSHRVRERALALMNRVRLQLDRPAMRVTTARSELPQLLSEVRSRRPRVITSDDRASVVMLTIDDLLSLLELTDPEAKASSLGALPVSMKPTQPISLRDVLEETPDEQGLPEHAHLGEGQARVSGR
jgi:hypothetical protein